MATDKRVYVNGFRYEVTYCRYEWTVWRDEGFFSGVTTVGKASSLEDAIRLAKVHQGDSNQRLEIQDR
ncbi:MAG: hypothetical protein IPG83_18125 [Novosphingobium sp.]|jgi:hypothetical protein|nr:hypothetical protein [Novosphingobium sp.]